MHPKPLDAWPRLTYEGDGWEMFIRHPPKKKITAQRYWKKVWVRIVMQGDNPAVLLFNHKDDKDPIQELPLQAAYSLSDISHQVFDQFTKVFTIKLQYIFYKEMNYQEKGSKQFYYSWHFEEKLASLTFKPLAIIKQTTQILAWTARSDYDKAESSWGWSGDSSGSGQSSASWWNPRDLGGALLGRMVELVKSG